MGVVALKYSSLCVYWTWPERLKKLQISLILISCFVLSILYGSVYTYGNLQPYLVSYIREKSHPSDLRFSQSTYMYSCQYAVLSVGIILGSFIERTLGPRLTILLGGGLTSMGLCLSYIVVKHSFWLLMLTFGAMYGLGTGLMYVGVILCVMKWLPKWSGTASGFVTSGAGFSNFVFSPIQTGLINPSDKRPDYAPYADNPDEKYFTQREIINTVPYLFLLQGLIVAVFMILMSIFMVSPTLDSTKEERSSHKPTPSLVTEQQNNLKPVQMVTKLNFYRVWFISLINVSTFGVFVSLYKSYGLEVVNASDYFLTVLGIVSGFSNIIGRFFFGLFADFCDFKFGFVLQSATMATILLTLYITSLQLPAMYFIWICGVFLCYGGYCSLLNVAMIKRFGEKHLNANFAIMMTSVLVGVILSGAISDFSLSSFGWLGMFWLLSGTCLIQFFLSLMITLTVYKTKRYNFNVHSILISNNYSQLMFSW